MKKRLKKYIKETDEKLENIKKQDIEKLKKEHITKIKIFQHERLVSLIATLYFALFTVICFLLMSTNIMFFIATTILVVMLLFFLFHYFYLEAGMKKLYDQYDKMI